MDKRGVLARIIHDRLLAPIAANEKRGQVRFVKLNGQEVLLHFTKRTPFYSFCLVDVQLLVSILISWDTQLCAWDNRSHEVAAEPAIV